MDPDNPTGQGGVAIVLNKQLNNYNNAKVTEIIPGRAIHIKTNWHRGDMISILAIYAPNVTRTNAAENTEFWTEITTFLDEHPEIKVDVMAGDFNMTEETIDRLPMRKDRNEAITALENLKQKINVVDGWRDTFPST